MNLSKMEIIALIVVIFIGLHFYNKHKMENEIFEETTETATYFGDKPPVIVAFGDSLTAGTGATEGFSYPAQLSQMLGIDVINAGVPGETTANALRRLPSVLQRYKPDIVILAVGMNDVLMGRKRDKIEENLVKMVELVKKAGAKPVIVGVPDMDLIELMISSDIGLYEDVAKKTGALYIPNVFGPVLKNEDLKNDHVHPNDRGYKVVAQKIYSYLREMY
ncbi:arylesterase [Hydrogenimonas sp.]|jgi:acyl-CoA hydrolase|uniref:arylesterase n=1 Tax=Hydrogenimonas sp. TaxID=2231112 RepID=UPI00263786DA|nr:arylesterase [Hydrogenimonas sp.]